MSRKNFSFLEKKALIIILACAACINTIYAQNIIDDAQLNIATADNPDIFTEKIEIISRSGKIFITTNSNQLLGKGDFITFILPGDGPFARAVVAKVHNERAGIKVLKVYSLKRWRKVKNGMDVQILKGDDSSLFQEKKPKEEVVAETKIEGEEDLFNDKTLFGDDVSDFYKDNRLIKPDNIVSASWDQFTVQNPSDGDTENHNQFKFSWAYQFADNYWVEGTFGRAQLDNFPVVSENIQTIVSNYTIKAKYTLNAPFYSYFMPYIGFQTSSVSTNYSDNVEDEKKAVDDLSTSQLAFGVTYLKRFVPGWFLMAEFGTDNKSAGSSGFDLFSLGFAIEF